MKKHDPEVCVDAFCEQCWVDAMDDQDALEAETNEREWQVAQQGEVWIRDESVYLALLAIGNIAVWWHNIAAWTS